MKHRRKRRHHKTRKNPRRRRHARRRNPLGLPSYALPILALAAFAYWSMKKQVTQIPSVV